MSSVRLLSGFFFNLALFMTGFVGIVLNRKNVLVTLMCIEIVLLAASLNFIIGSVFSGDLIGEIFVVFVVATAAAESSIALSIMLSMHKFNPVLTMKPIKKFYLKF